MFFLPLLATYFSMDGTFVISGKHMARDQNPN